MRMLSGTAVWVDNTPNEMQVDLSPCKHPSLPSQSLIQRQPKRVWPYCVLWMQLSTGALSLTLYLSVHLLVPFVFVSPTSCLYTYRPLVLLCASGEGLQPDSSQCSDRNQHVSDPKKGLGTFNKNRNRQENNRYER